MIYTETISRKVAEGVWPDSWRLHIRLYGCCRLINYVPYHAACNRLPGELLRWHQACYYPVEIASHSPSSLKPFRFLELTERSRPCWFLPPNSGPPHSQLGRRGGQSHRLIHAATASWPGAVASCLNLCTAFSR